MTGCLLHFRFLFDGDLWLDVALVVGGVWWAGRRRAGR